MARSFGGWKPEIKVLADSVFGESCFLIHSWWLRPVSSQSRWGGNSLKSLEWGAQIPSWALYSDDFITSQKPHHWTPRLGDWGFNMLIWGTQTFRPFHTVLHIREVFVKVFECIRAPVANSTIAFILSSTCTITLVINPTLACPSSHL